MLDVDNLCKKFNRRDNPPVTALNSVSLSAQAGECVCLLGPNGSGKTTFLKILAGLILPDSGQAVIAGHNVLTELRQVQKKVGFSPAADRSFYGRLSGFENLRFFASLRGLDARALREKLDVLDKPLQLNETLRTAYQRASSGMKQRLSLARALLHDPAVLLLDEPTQSLDPEAAEHVRNYIKKDYLSDGDRLVLCSTQQPDEAWEIGTHLLILRNGKLLTEGTPAELLRRAGTSSPSEAYLHLSQSNPS